MTNPPRASSLRPDSPRHRRVFAVPGFLSSLLSRYELWRADRWAKQYAQQDDDREAIRREMLEQYGSVG